MAQLLAGLLSTMGLTVLVVWPDTGPSAWARERILRPALPKPAKPVLDCYICFSFWAGIIVSPVTWQLTGETWSWLLCLMTPALFWLALRETKADADERAFVVPVDNANKLNNE